MAHTHYQIYIQTVFAVKYRESVIDAVWQDQLFAVMHDLIRETGCTPVIINGVSDHVHCLIGLRPAVSVADLMKRVKGNSSRWLNESGLLSARFAWQTGYGAFSYSQSHVGNVVRYIQNQEAHHREQTFRDEYLGFLQKFEVPFDEQHIFDDLC